MLAAVEGPAFQGFLIFQGSLPSTLGGIPIEGIVDVITRPDIRSASTGLYLHWRGHVVPVLAPFEQPISSSALAILVRLADDDLVAIAVEQVFGATTVCLSAVTGRTDQGHLQLGLRIGLNSVLALDPHRLSGATRLH